MDTWLLNKAQEWYTWLWNRTGIYIGTIYFSVFVLSCLNDIWLNGPLVIQICMIFWVGMSGGISYYWQDKKMYEKLNECAMIWEESTVRRWMVNPIIVYLMVSKTFQMAVLGFVCIAFLIPWSYIETVTVADREPPEEKTEMAWRGI